MVNGKMGAVVLTATDVGARPDAWVPAWEDVTGKPTIIAPRGTIGPAIPALYAGKSAAQSIASSSPVKRITFPAEVYDQFSAWNGSVFTVPEWARFARVSTNVILNAVPAGVRGGPYIQKNDGRIAYASSTPSGTQIYGPLVSPIFPVVEGDQLSVDYWHSHTAALSTLGTDQVWIQIELYE